VLLLQWPANLHPIQCESVWKHRNIKISNLTVQDRFGLYDKQ
jgi:hypothetical protein